MSATGGAVQSDSMLNAADGLDVARVRLAAELAVALVLPTVAVALQHELVSAVSRVLVRNPSVGVGE